MNWIQYRNNPLINLDNIDTIDDKTINTLMFYGTGSNEATQWIFNDSAERDRVYRGIKESIVHVNLEDLKSDG